MRSSHVRPQPLRAAFTLIELLVVMAIIAVLISITVPAVFKAQEASNRTNCSNNLRQMGFAFTHHHQQFGYFPTAGSGDFAAPVYSTNTTGTGSSSTSAFNPIGGWKQDAGWGYQILPYVDAEPIWNGSLVASSGTSVTTVIGAMENSIGSPVKLFFCPSRRRPTTNSTYKNSSFPMENSGTKYASNYSSVQGSQFTTALSDYAGCNGSATAGAPTVQNGAVLSQANGRAIVSTTDIKDGTSTTLLIGEKAANPKVGFIANEDDLGYFSGYGTYGTSTVGTNFNTIRFTSQNLLPLRDFEVTSAGTGGAFGSNHVSAFNALMCDGSVIPISYNINANVYQALGTISGNEIITDLDLTP